MTAADDVESPLNPSVSPVRVIGHVMPRFVSEEMSIEFPKSAVTFPPEYVRPPEKVVVATHPGMPLAIARINPLALGDSSEMFPAEDPYNKSPKPIAPPAKSFPSIVPVQAPVRSKVNAPPVSCNPEPSKLLNNEPLTIRFVVEAVTNDEYIVDEEYWNVWRAVKVLAV